MGGRCNGKQVFWLRRSMASSSEHDALKGEHAVAEEAGARLLSQSRQFPSLPLELPWFQAGGDRGCGLLCCHQIDNVVDGDGDGSLFVKMILLHDGGRQMSDSCRSLCH